MVVVVMVLVVVVRKKGKRENIFMSVRWIRFTNMNFFLLVALVGWLILVDFGYIFFLMLVYSIRYLQVTISYELTNIFCFFFYFFYFGSRSHSNNNKPISGSIIVMTQSTSASTLFDRTYNYQQQQ